MPWSRLLGTLSWTTNRQLLLLGVAYLSAIASVGSFVLYSLGLSPETGR